jgi:hypothetical protein
MEQIGTLLFIDNDRTEQRAVGSAVHQFVNEFIVKSTACGIVPIRSKVKFRDTCPMDRRQAHRTWLAG